MWLFLWIVFVLAVIVAFIWSYHVLFEQKRAWKVFADKYGMNYITGGFFESPAMGGYIKGRRVNIYAQRKIDGQTGASSNQSVVEVFLNDIPDIIAIVTSPGFMDFQQMIDLPDPFNVEHPSWPAHVLARTTEDDVPEEWFENNPARVEAISQLTKLPFDTGFIANVEQAFVVVRTSHPLTEPKRINQIIGKLFEIAAMLEGASAPKTEAKATEVKEEPIKTPSQDEGQTDNHPSSEGHSNPDTEAEQTTP